MGLITTSDEHKDALLDKLAKGKKLVGHDLVQEVSAQEPYDWPPDDMEPEDKLFSPCGGL